MQLSLAFFAAVAAASPLLDPRAGACFNNACLDSKTSSVNIVASGVATVDCILTNLCCAELAAGTLAFSQLRVDCTSYVQTIITPATT